MVHPQIKRFLKLTHQWYILKRKDYINIKKDRLFGEDAANAWHLAHAVPHKNTGLLLLSLLGTHVQVAPLTPGGLAVVPLMILVRVDVEGVLL